MFVDPLPEFLQSAEENLARPHVMAAADSTAKFVLCMILHSNNPKVLQNVYPVMNNSDNKPYDYNHYRNVVSDENV